MENIDNPSEMAAALAMHPYGVRCRMVAQLLRSKAANALELHRRAQLVTLLREQELWPNEKR